MAWLYRFFVGLFAVLGVLVIATLAAGWFVWDQVLREPELPRRMVLELDLDQGVVEADAASPLRGLTGKPPPVVRDIVATLAAAADDDRVAGLVARLGGGEIGIAQAQDIRNAVLAFRARGKFAFAFAESFGEFGPGTRPYYLATAFDSVRLQPLGTVGLTGLIAETLFFKGALDKLEIEPALAKREEFKTALNALTEREFTPAHRESLESVLDSLYDQIVAGIAETRGKPADAVRALIDRGPLLGPEALENGLIDAIAYRDEVKTVARERGGDATFVPFARYAARVPDAATRIAVVTGTGLIVRGQSPFDPLSGAAGIGADSIAAALRAATEDQRVKAIILRIDSGGGSAVASETIWREVVRARQAGKPVVASLGNVAGSGGYYIALGADQIVAQPGTITGSIGVIAGKVVTSRFLEGLGIQPAEIHRGGNATMWSGLKPYAAEEWQRLQAFLDHVYQGFTAHVADARDLPRERVAELAQGKIYTGAQAKTAGLVDELGGFPEAVRIARDLARVPAGAKIALAPYPRPRSPAERLAELLLDGESDESFHSIDPGLSALIGPLRPLLRQIAILAGGPDRQALAMPPLGVE